MPCRSCGHDELRPVLDLGSMPLVNNLLDAPDEDAPRWPLAVARCPACTFVQLLEAPPPSAMFDEYCYFSSQSQTMVAHANDLVRRHVRRGDRVVEIASNDGYLLVPARAAGATVLGVEPARNVADAARAAGVPTRGAYFDAALARDLRESFGAADVFFANNVLAHVPDPNEIVAGLAVLLAGDGRAHVEVPWLVPLVETGAFDTIYHEHVGYYSVHALAALVHRHGLRVVGVEPIAIHGGSLHVTIARAGDESECDAMLALERTRGIHDDAFHARLADAVDRLRASLAAALAPFERVAAYGAAAKGVVLLNALDLGRERVAWVADVSPHKQGRYVPGTGQPIVGPERLLDDAPEACLVLPWNLRDEVVRRNRAYLEAGGRFIVPRPRLEVIDARCGALRTAR